MRNIFLPNLTDVEDDQRLREYYAEELCTLSAVPEYLRSYFDCESYGRDIRLECLSASSAMGL